MPINAIFKSEFITETCATKRAIAKAFLCLLIIGTSPILMAISDGSVASAKALPEANTVVSAEMKPSPQIETMAGERRSVAESNKAASKQLEPLMLFLLGTMLLSIGAAIKFVGARSSR